MSGGWLHVLPELSRGPETFLSAGILQHYLLRLPAFLLMSWFLSLQSSIS